MNAYPIDNPAARKIVSFLAEIGLPVHFTELSGPTFLPGIRIVNGVLNADPGSMTWCGDLLHEAGHLAVLPPAERAATGDDAGADGGMEMAAIAWSWAALVHLHLDPQVVFHEGGYRNGSRELIDNFREGRWFGVPLLQWMGLTAEPKLARDLGIPAFPHMRRWLRE